MRELIGISNVIRILPIGGARPARGRAGSPGNEALVITGIRISGVLMLMLMVSMPGCRSQPYEPGVYYEPQPALVEVVYRAAGQPEQVPMTALASVRGIRRADEKAGMPESVEVRLRLENHGPSHVEFDPGSPELTTGALRTFPPPRVRPATPVELSPGQSQTVIADFPLPGGLDSRSAELDHLRLRWRVTINGQPVPQTALFVREQSREYSSDDADW